MRQAGLLFSLSFIVFLTACGESTLKPDATAQTVVRTVFKDTGFRATDMRCPSGVPAKVGEEFECHFAGPEGPYTAYLRVTSVHGERVEFHIETLPTNDAIKPRPTEQTVTRAVFKSTGFRAHDVRCPSGVPPRIGGKFECHFTGPEGPYTAYLRIVGVKGEGVDFNIVTRRSKEPPPR